MSYFRPSMGDGPVTDPCQVDPSLCPKSPAPDSSGGGGVTDWFLGLVRPVFQSAPSSAPAGGDNHLLLLGGAAVAAYFLFSTAYRDW